MDASRDTVRRFAWPVGYTATANTLREMARVTRAQAPDPRIRARARALTAHLRPLDFAGEIRAVWDFLRSSVRYVHDPIGVEYVTEPTELDRQVDEGDAAEDCEGLALYAATLLASIGIESLFAVLGDDPAKPDRFRHCALVVLMPDTGASVWFDPVAPLYYDGFELGDTVHREGEPLELWSLDGTRVGPTREGGSMDGTTYRPDLGDVDATQIIGGFLDALKAGGSSFGPYGALAADVVQVGQDVYHATTGKYLGKAVIPPPPPGTKPSANARQAIFKAGLPPDASSSSGAGTALAVGGGLALLAFLL